MGKYETSNQAGQPGQLSLREASGPSLRGGRRGGQSPHFAIRPSWQVHHHTAVINGQHIADEELI